MKNPYEILGVSVTDDKDIVRRVFESRFRNYQSLQKEGKYTEDMHREYLELNEAYEIIMGIKREDDIVNDVPQGKLAGEWYHMRKWLDNCWYHYKIYIVFVLLGMLVMVSFLTMPQFRLKKSISVSIPNIASSTNMEMVVTNIRIFIEKVLPEYDNVTVICTDIKDKNSINSFKDRLDSRKVKDILSGFSGQDIVIVDKEGFDKLADSNKLLELDEMVTDALDNNIKLYGKTEKDNPGHIYGVGLNFTELLSNSSKGRLIIKSDYEFVVAISTKAGNPKDCFKVVQAMVGQQ